MVFFVAVCRENEAELEVLLLSDQFSPQNNGITCISLGYSLSRSLLF